MIRLVSLMYDEPKLRISHNRRSPFARAVLSPHISLLYLCRPCSVISTETQHPNSKNPYEAYNLLKFFLLTTNNYSGHTLTPLIGSCMKLPKI